MYLYFWSIFKKCCRSMAWFYLQKIEINYRQIEAKGTVVVCLVGTNFHVVNWEIKQASILCKPNMPSQIRCIKVCLIGHSNMFEFVEWGFLSWNILSNFFAHEQWSRAFWDISKGICCGAMFYSQCNKLETSMRSWSYCSFQKEIKILVFERCTVIMSAGQ